MMQGMIENGARQGVRESFEQHATLLAQNVRLVDPMDIASDKEQVLASVQVEPQSDSGNWVSIQGLEFVGLDLPDSVGEVIACFILVLQGQQVLALVSRFMHARVKRDTYLDQLLEINGAGRSAAATAPIGTNGWGKVGVRISVYTKKESTH
ncbi:hypothetical protein AgCh_005897 [Apium graveolens]